MKLSWEDHGAVALLIAPGATLRAATTTSRSPGRSPSPPATSTSRSGFESLTPCAMGSARPCTLLNP